MAPDANELVVMIGSSLAALLALAKGIEKLGDLLTMRRGDRRQWERDDFGSVLEAREQEIARLREDNTELDRRHKERRDECHVLRNQIMGLMDQVQVLQIELDTERRAHGKGPWVGPNEDGDPK